MQTASGGRGRLPSPLCTLCTVNYWDGSRIDRFAERVPRLNQVILSNPQLILSGRPSITFLRMCLIFPNLKPIGYNRSISENCQQGHLWMSNRKANQSITRMCVYNPVKPKELTENFLFLLLKRFFNHLNCFILKKAILNLSIIKCWVILWVFTHNNASLRIKNVDKSVQVLKKHTLLSHWLRFNPQKV